MKAYFVSLLAVLGIASTTLVGAALGAPADDTDAVRTRVFEPRTAETQDARLTSSATCVSDPTGDVVNFDTGEEEAFGPADITQACADYASNITVTLQLVGARDPSTDPNWVDGFTDANWFLDFDSDDLPEFWALFYNDGGVRLLVSSCGPGPSGHECSTANAACEGTPSWDSSGYTGVFPASCVGSPASFRMQSTMSYDDFGTFYADEAPDFGGWSQPVSSSAGTPPPPAPPPEPGPARDTARLAGANRIETAVQISQYQFPNGAAEVYLAVADNFPDALAGGALTNGPILLVPSCGDLPQVVGDEIRRLNPARVVALGGTAVVCDSILNQAASA